jgi:hypothetical protein
VGRVVDHAQVLDVVRLRHLDACFPAVAAGAAVVDAEVDGDHVPLLGAGQPGLDARRAVRRGSGLV